MDISKAGRDTGEVSMAADIPVSAIPILRSLRKKEGVGEPALSITSFMVYFF